MPFADYVLNNFVTLFSLIGLLIILFISVHIPKKVKFYLRIAVLLIFVSMVVTVFENWTQTFETLSPWRYILTSAKYLSYPATMIILVAMISEMVRPISKKWLLLLAIPEFISIPLYFTSQWSHIVFWFSEDNGYNGGALSYLPYIIFALYVVAFIVLNIYYLRYYSVKNKIIALYICLASLACIGVYLIVNKTDDYNPIFSISLVFYFLFLYIHMASIDPLTGLMNRQSYYQDVLENRRKISYAVSVDMNDLKLINDSQGHHSGDEALVTVSKILKVSSGNKAICYRVGGDEFILLFFDSSEEEIKEKIALMRGELAKTPYTCAFGYAKKKSGISIEEAVKEADQKMYIDKAEIKKNNK